MSLDKKTEKKCKKEQKQQKQKKRDLGCGFNKLNMQDDGTMTPCVHQVYVHHIVEQPHCKPMVRKGGIFSRDYDEGKKVRWWHFFTYLYHLIKWRFIS